MYLKTVLPLFVVWFWWLAASLHKECGFAHWIWRITFSWYNACYDILCRYKFPDKIFEPKLREYCAFLIYLNRLEKQSKATIILFCQSWKVRHIYKYVCKEFYSAFNHVSQVPENTLDLTIAGPGHRIQWALFWLPKQNMR